MVGAEERTGDGAPGDAGVQATATSGTVPSVACGTADYAPIWGFDGTKDESIQFKRVCKPNRTDKAGSSTQPNHRNSSIGVKQRQILLHIIS